jgi:hypothetical protein
MRVSVPSDHRSAGPARLGSVGFLCLLTLFSSFCAGAMFEATQCFAEKDDLQIEITPKGLGKEVLIHKGNKEWFMLIEVTLENSMTVVVRQEKENETYLVDESETHDRAMTKGEVDAAIEAFINSVKSRVERTGH